MAKYSQFKIDLKNLPDGINSYSYELDRKYFDTIDHEEVRKGNVNVEMTVKKTIDAFEFNFHLTGTIQIPCNRCLDEMDQEIDTHNRLVVNLGEAYSEESDELIIIPADEGEINIAWYLYEFIVLDIPIKHVHEPGKCNKVMSSKYRKHKAVSIDDDEDDDIEEFDDEVLDEDVDEDSNDDLKDTDPRWDALKKLI